MNSHLLFPSALVLALATCVLATTLTPSTYLLQSFDSRINLTCAGFTPTTTTSYAFYNNGQQMFNSTTNVTASGVQYYNKSSISYSRALSSGLTNLNCNATNQPVSPSIQVPYMAPSIFTPSPRKFNISSPTTNPTTINATCQVSFTPTPINTYQVVYWINSTQIAQWLVTGNTYTYSYSANSLPANSMTYGPTYARAPTFSANFTPRTIATAGRWYCSVNLLNTPAGTFAASPSNVWATDASFGLGAPSLGMILLVTLVIKTFAGRM